MMENNTLEVARKFRACKSAKERHRFAAETGTTVNQLWTLWLRAGRPEPYQKAQD